MLDVFEHVPAFLLTAPAFRSTMLHVRIVRMLLAGFGAAGARLGTPGTNQAGKWTPAGDDLRGRRTECSTILTRPERFQVLLAAGCDEVGTVRRAGIAGPLTGPAGGGAGVAHFVRAPGRRSSCRRSLLLREPGRLQTQHRRRRHPRQSEFSTSHHDLAPCVRESQWARLGFALSSRGDGTALCRKYTPAESTATRRVSRTADQSVCCAPQRI